MSELFMNLLPLIISLLVCNIVLTPMMNTSCWGDHEICWSGPLIIWVVGSAIAIPIVILIGWTGAL